MRLDLRNNSARGDLLEQGGAAWLDAFGAQLTVSKVVAAGIEAGLSATATVCGGGLYGLELAPAKVRRSVGGVGHPGQMR